MSLVCTVDAVDKTARTVDCSPLDESAPLLGVNLQANQENDCGIVVFPKVGSFVVVGFVAEGSAGVVLLTDEVESVEIVIDKDTARMTADKDAVRILMGDRTSAELTTDGIILKAGDRTNAALDGDGITLDAGNGMNAKLTKDGITLNGGQFGGIVKIAELTQKLNAIEDDINALKNVFTSWAPVAQDGGAALKTAVCAAWADNQLTPTQKSDIENEKVKHG